MHSRRRPETAARLLSLGQMIMAAGLVLLAVVGTMAFGPVVLLKTAVALAIMFYLMFVGLKFILWWAAAGSRLPHYPLPSADDPNLPR